MKKLQKQPHGSPLVATEMTGSCRDGHRPILSGVAPGSSSGPSTIAAGEYK